MKPQKIIIPVLALFSVVNCYAQDTTVYFIPAGHSILEKLTPAKQFKYPEFRPGTVLFKDGTSASSNLNYSYLSGEVEFIGPANDTLAISDDKSPLIKEILIDSNAFCYNKEYFEVIASHPETGRFLKKQFFAEMFREKIGAFDQASPTGSVETFGSVGNSYHSIVDGLIAREDLYLRITTGYFIENKNLEIAPLNKKNLLKLNSSKRRAINDYLNKNRVNFNNEADLKRLFNAIK